MSSAIRKHKVTSDGDADDTRLLSQARMLLRLCYKWALTSRNSTQLVSISIYPPSPRRNGDWLVIGKAFDQGYRLVTFRRSPNPLTALLGLLQTIQDGSATWKEDTYADTAREWLRK